MTQNAGTISFSANEIPLGNTATGISRHGVTGKPNGDVIRVRYGAAPAPQKTCPRQESVVTGGSTQTKAGVCP